MATVHNFQAVSDSTRIFTK